MGDRGSATLLVPVGMLLMVTLGAIAVDLSHLHTAHMALQARADAAANDAVTAGLDMDALRAGEGYNLEPTHVRRAATRAATITPRGGLHEITVDVKPTGPQTVAVEVAASVDLIFAPALPGGPQSVAMRATATATAEIR